MPNDMTLGEWAGFLDREYLSTFIKDGGGAIKFCIPVNEDIRPDLIRTLNSIAVSSDYIAVAVDAADTRIHMPQDIFFAMARQVDWRQIARRFLLGVARCFGYNVDGIDHKSSSNIYVAIAELNGLAPEFLWTVMSPQIQSRVYFNHRMSRDFRLAMLHLCLKEQISVGQPYEGQPLIDWLTGDNTRVSSVRPFLIYSGINRSTARYFIESATYWFQQAGYSGTFIILDNSRVSLARNPRDGSRYYSRSMATDHYELLRQFIDGTDRLVGTLMIVVPNADFLDPEPSGRGYGIYPALQTRVMDDVRDRSMVNPMASLVRLT